MRFVSDACSATTASVRPVICCLIVLDSVLSVLNSTFLLMDVEIRKSVYNMWPMRSMWSMRCFVGPVGRGCPLARNFFVLWSTMAYFGEFWGAKFKVCNNVGGDVPVDVPQTKILEGMCPRHPRQGWRHWSQAYIVCSCTATSHITWNNDAVENHPVYSQRSECLVLLAQWLTSIQKSRGWHWFSGGLVTGQTSWLPHTLKAADFIETSFSHGVLRWIDKTCDISKLAELLFVWIDAVLTPAL